MTRVAAAGAVGLRPAAHAREPARLPPLRPADRPRRQRLPLLRAAPARAQRVLLTLARFPPRRARGGDRGARAPAPVRRGRRDRDDDAGHLDDEREHDHQHDLDHDDDRAEEGELGEAPGAAGPRRGPRGRRPDPGTEAAENGEEHAGGARRARATAGGGSAAGGDSTGGPPESFEQYCEQSTPGVRVGRAGRSAPSPRGEVGPVEDAGALVGAGVVARAADLLLRAAALQQVLRSRHCPSARLARQGRSARAVVGEVRRPRSAWSARRSCPWDLQRVGEGEDRPVAEHRLELDHGALLDSLYIVALRLEDREPGGGRPLSKSASSKNLRSCWFGFERSSPRRRSCRPGAPCTGCGARRPSSGSR